MKLAILLFGNSKLKGYNHWTFGQVEIDYKLSCDNYDKYIFQFFKKRI